MTMNDCDPVYERLILDIVKQHGEEAMNSALVFVNSFDFEKDDIEDVMTDRRIYTEVVEVDRMRSEERGEYLSCFKKLY